jgi:hypothetical protein
METGVVVEGLVDNYTAAQPKVTIDTTARNITFLFITPPGNVFVVCRVL